MEHREKREILEAMNLLVKMVREDHRDPVVKKAIVVLMGNQEEKVMLALLVREEIEELLQALLVNKGNRQSRPSRS